MNNEVAFYIKAIEDRKAELQNSDWLSRIYGQLNTIDCKINEVRCLALGKVSDFLNPRFQLAFLLLLCSRLNVTNITAWDPAFVETDRLLLKHYNIEVVEADPASSSELLWYVPHGPLSLVAELPSKIGRGIYIGNDLSTFPLEDKNQKETLEHFKSHSRITSIVPEKHYRWQLAFSSTAIHQPI